LIPAPDSPRRHELPAAFTVLEFGPSPKRDMWTYATCGMSQPGDTSPLELHMFAAHQAWQLAELLTAIAHYHRTGQPLGLGHTVNFGRPWLPGSACDHGLISLPYLDGPSLERMPAEGGSTVTFAWLIPITPRERDYKRDNGLEALETLMDQQGFNYLDPDRASLA
jgi:hypothetical protein